MLAIDRNTTLTWVINLTPEQRDGMVEHLQAMTSKDEFVLETTQYVDDELEPLPNKAKTVFRIMPNN